MEYFSVCGSDLRVYDRVLPEENYPLALGAPCLESVGIVEESADDRLQSGQRVIALLAGGLLEYAAIPASNAIAVPDMGDPALWVLCQPVGTVMYSVQQMGSVLGKRVAILGQGPIGLAFTDFIARAGARDVFVSDLHDYRLDIARRLGATHMVNATRDNIVEAVREVTGGKGVDFAVDAAGRPETAQQVFEALRPKGTVVLFGIPHHEDVFPVDWTRMMYKQPRIIATISASGGDMPLAVEETVSLVKQGRLDLSHLLTHRMPWDKVNDAYELYSHKHDNSLKVVINM
jgi:L-iditol 2-dehydrogenase